MSAYYRNALDLTNHIVKLKDRDPMIREIMCDIMMDIILAKEKKSEEKKKNAKKKRK